jgi:hypothetical protein
MEGKIGIIGHGSMHTLYHQVLDDLKEDLRATQCVLTAPINPDDYSFYRQPKINCKKGHTYSEQKEEGGIIKYKCRCGKTL